MATQASTDNRRPVLDEGTDSAGPPTLARRVNERFRRENPQHIRQFLSVSFARFCSRSARAIPTPLRYWSADRLGDLMYVVVPGYRQNVLSNLTHVYRSIGLSEPTKRDVRRIFHISSRNWADLLVVPGRSRAQFEQDFVVSAESIAHLDTALSWGKGCIILTAHVGAFDYMGHFLHALGYKLTIVTGRTTARIVFDGVTYLRQSNGLSLVEATPSGVRKAIQTVMQGNCAVIVCDRDFFQNGVPVTFFGDDTTLPPGAVRIARDTGAAIVPVFAKRIGDRHRMSVYEPFLIERTSNAVADTQSGMEAVIKAMEIALKDAPDQWVMFQRVWPLEQDDSVA